MNIWLFNHYAVPPDLYPLARPYNFAKYLIRDGHSVTIFAASTVHNSNKNLIDKKYKNNYLVKDIDKIKYIFIKACNYSGNGIKRIKNMFQYFFRIFKISKMEAKHKKPDIIIATSVHPLTCVAGITIAKKLNIKCIVEIADLWPLTLVELGKLSNKSIITKFMYKLEHWIYKRADAIVFTMEGGKDYIKDMGWSMDTAGVIDLNKVYHINNGVDFTTYNSNILNENIEDIELEENQFFKVIYTGSIGEANLVRNIIYAAELLKNNGYSNIKFIIYGDGQEKKDLEDYCKKKDLSNVRFKGKVDKKYVPYILSKADLTIFTGKNVDLYKYGLSLNKMFDYLASGKPILSNIECGYDILKKYKCGITVKGGNTEALADGILKFYNMPKDEYDIYRKNALKVAQYYDFKRLTNKLEQVISNTMNKTHKEI